MKKLEKYKLILIIVIVLIVIDQILKIMASTIWQDEGKVIADGVLSISYYKNTGGFMGKPQSMMSLIITDLVIIALIIRFIMLQSENMNLLTKVSLSMIIAGGISNLADRIFLGGIIDYIDFTMLNSNLPILNLSDVYEILGFVLFAVSMAIYTHSEIKKKKDKKKDIKEEV